MARKMKKATELPDMSGWSEKKISAWLETHDTTEILKKGILDKQVRDKVSKETKKHMSLRIEPTYIEIAKNIASKKGIGYQTFIRSLIVEGITREPEN